MYNLLFEILQHTWGSISSWLSASSELSPAPTTSGVRWRRPIPLMLENTVITDAPGKGCWKQSSAASYGICTPQQLSARAGTSKEHKFAVKLVVLICLAWSSSLLFCVLFCNACTQVSQDIAHLIQILPPPGSAGYLQKAHCRLLLTSGIPGTWKRLIQMQQLSIIYQPWLADICECMDVFTN